MLRNENLTPKKFISFTAVNGIGALVFMGIQYPLSEMKVHYLIATGIAGAVAMVVKFILAGVFTYRR